MARQELHIEIERAVVTVEGLTDNQILALYDNVKSVIAPIWDDLREMVVIHQVQEKLPQASAKRFSALMARNAFNYLSNLEKYTTQ